MERSVYHRLAELEGQHWWFSARREILKSVIARFAPQGRVLRLMEAGCGTGGNLSMLAEFGSLEAFEFDEEARIVAGRKLAHVKHGMLPNGIPFPPGSFDIVAALDVIEHVEQDVESLHGLKNQLAKGGRLVITVPAMPWLWSRHDETHHHYRRYTKQSLESALRQAGLRIVYISYFNTLLFPLVASVRLLKKALRYEGADDDTMPPVIMNRMLKVVFGLERQFIGHISLPIGISLIAIAENR